MVLEEEVPSCRFCGEETEFSHVDGVETKWFKCKKCNEYTDKPKRSPDNERENFDVEVIRTMKGWLLRRGSLQWGPTTYKPDSMCNDEEIREICETLQLPEGRPRSLLRQLLHVTSITHQQNDEEKWTLADKLALLEAKPLPHINLIENPSTMEEPVIVDAIVSSTSIAYAAPKEIEFSYPLRNGKEVDGQQTIGNADPLNIKLVGVSDDAKFFKICRAFKIPKNAKIDEPFHRTVYLLRVRPPVFALEEKNGKIVDEQNYEYKAYDIYVTSEKELIFTPSRLIRIQGYALPNPKTQKITVLGYHVVFPEETHSYDAEAVGRLKNKFASMTVRERKEWVLTNFEKKSHIINRKNLAFTGFLAYFSPLYVRLNGDIQRGWANNCLIGDTTTGKSQTIRNLISLLQGGTLITAELASKVGLTGTATQLEKGGWFVDWGFLVLCDRRLLAVDGAHKLRVSEWAALAESERNGKVTIAKAAKNEAYARTRQIKITNPVDQEKGKYSTRALASFLYPCQALTTIFDKITIARIDLVSFADTSDVEIKDINQKFTDPYDEDLDLLSETLKWCWSGTAQATFEEDALTYLLEKSTYLYDQFYSEQVPLVNADMKWKIARLSVALAYLTISTTDDLRTIIVTKEHVQEIVDYLEKEYDQNGLGILSKETKHEKMTLEEVKMLLFNISAATKHKVSQDKVKGIMKFIVVNNRVTRDEIKTKFSLSEKNELRPLLSALSSEGLIKSGHGYYPERKLIELYKILIEEDKNFANFAKVANPGKDGGGGSQTQLGGGGSFPDPGKHGKLGKKTEKLSKNVIIKVSKLRDEILKQTSREEPFKRLELLSLLKKMDYDEAEAIRCIKQLVREGVLFAPRQGYIKSTFLRRKKE